MDRRRTPCSSPSTLPSRLPPAVRMPMLRNQGTQNCECEACQKRKNSTAKCETSLSVLKTTNKESNLGKLEREFDVFFNRNMPTQRNQTNSTQSYQKNREMTNYGRRNNGPTNITGLKNFNMDLKNPNIEHLKIRLVSRNFRQIGLSAGYDRFSSAFNNGIVHFLTELILIFIIVLTATVAVWIAFFQLMYKIAIAIQNSKNRHVKTMVIVFVALLLFSLLGSVVQNKYREIKQKRAKMHRKSHWQILPSRVETPNYKSNWYSTLRWGQGKKTCTEHKFFPLWGRQSEEPRKIYNFWKSECPYKKISKDKPFYVFWRPAPPKTLGERVSNIIFFWRPPQRQTWFGIIVSHDQYKKHKKRESWTSILYFRKKAEYKKRRSWSNMLHFRKEAVHKKRCSWTSMFHSHKKVENKGIYRRMCNWWRNFIHTIKSMWRTFYKKFQEAERKRKWQKSCGCKSSYFFWTNLCTQHKLQAEKAKCPMCRLSSKPVSEQYRVKDMRKAYKRSKLYTMPMEMKSPPTVLTYLNNELRRSL